MTRKAVQSALHSKEDSGFSFCLLLGSIFLRFALELFLLFRGEKLCKGCPFFQKGRQLRGQGLPALPQGIDLPGQLRIEGSHIPLCIEGGKPGLGLICKQ